MKLLPLHLFAVLIWALGINLMCSHRAGRDKTHGNRHAFINKWGIGALLLGLFTFPGSGTIAYSAALTVAALLPRKRGEVSRTDASKRLGRPTTLEQTLENILLRYKRGLALPAQPTIDALQDTDIETKRLAVATLRRQGTPEAMKVLRQLLRDSHPDIRSDASIALTNLEEKLSQTLNSVLEQWMKNPTDKKSMLNLANQYYEYAQSNVLDDASQHFYLVKAHDLLEQVITPDTTQPDLWLKLARVCQRLNRYEEALRNVRVALRLSAPQPDPQTGRTNNFKDHDEQQSSSTHLSDAYLLAMELAFELRDWNSLISFAHAGVRVLPEASEVSESLQWWATLQAQQLGDTSHV